MNALTSARRLADRLPPSRHARVTEVGDFLLSIENTERAREQSARTVDGQRAEPPQRRPMLRLLHPSN